MEQTEKWGQFAVIAILGVATALAFVRIYRKPLSPLATLVHIASLNIAIVGVGIGAGSFFGKGSFYPPIFAFIATGLVTFFGLLGHTIRSVPNARIEDRDIRNSIAASITTMYMVLVGYGVWVSDSGKSDPIAQSLMTSFSVVVATVISFYFGTTAYLEAQKASAPTSDAPASGKVAAPADGGPGTATHGRDA